MTASSYNPSYSHPTITHKARCKKNNRSDLYLEIFGSNPRWRLVIIRFSQFTLVPPGKFWKNTLKIGHNYFLSSPFQCNIHNHPLISHVAK
jgi:hypothetical protein